MLQSLTWGGGGGKVPHIPGATVFLGMFPLIPQVPNRAYSTPYVVESPLRTASIRGNILMLLLSTNSPLPNNLNPKP